MPRSRSHNLARLATYFRGLRMPPGLRTGLRLGIAARLSIAFGAVAVLTVAANLIAEHGTSIIRTIEVRPIVQSAPAPPSTEALSAAIHRFGRSVLDRVDDGGAEQRREAREAAQELRQQVSIYVAEARGIVDRARLRTLTARAQAHEQQADVLVRLSDVRRLRLREYWDLFEALDARVKAAVDRAWKVFGRVLARRSLLELSQRLDGLRRGLAVLAMPDGYDAAVVEEIAASETAFATMLEQNAPGMARSQGEEWVTRVREDFARLIAIRTSLVLTDAEHRDAIGKFSRSNRDLAALTQAGSASRPGALPGVSGVTDASVLAAAAAAVAAQQPTITTTATFEEDSGQRALIGWVSAAVLLLLLAISIGTVISIVRPVRRLMLATRRVADGDPRVTVPRGGIRELDSLAVSFNQMAERLGEAQAVARQYQGQLEAKVAERTRQLQHLAEHDPLTELPNRRQLFAQLNAALTTAAERGCMVGVFFLDLDNFKNINDSMGHALGDRVLECMAERLREEVGASGFAARLGGDEFTVVCERAAGAEEICDIGQALVRAFQRPLTVDDRQLSLSISVGASFYPDHGEDAETLLRAADAALFRAKALGRSQLSVFSPELLDAAASKFDTEQGLRRAVERGEFELAFQPEVNADTLRVDLVEALLRWRLPDGRLAHPGDFLAVAEESSLIQEISDWVLRSAIETAAQWHHGAWPGVRISINVSARQLLSGRFVDSVQELLREHRLPADRIEIELTENVLQTGPGTVDALRQIHACGIGVALDDFGTGYSSLYSLEQLPLTRVKLDRSLIARIDESERSMAIARAIIGLCHGLDLEVTAEGIERPEQLALLLEYRPLCLQGHLLSRPVAGSDLPSEIARIPVRMRTVLRNTRYKVSAAQRRRAG